MKALAAIGPSQAAVLEVAMPHPDARGAVIRTTAASICTTDVHMLAGARALPYGRVLGHESVGVVHEVGPDVRRLQVGDRVVVGAITPCGTCAWCQRGQASQCGGDRGTTRFVSRRDGTLAEYFLVNDADYNAAVIPDGVSDAQAVYAADMLPTGMVAIENAAVPIGGTLLILGQGPVGLSATLFARLTGAASIVVVDPDPRRRAIALSFGADVALDPTVGTVEEQSRELVPDGYDSAIDAAGMSTSTGTCARNVRRGGTITNIAMHSHGDTLSLPLDAITFGIGDKTLRMPLAVGGSEALGRILRLIAVGRVDPTPLTTHTFEFADSAEALHLMTTKSDGILKPLITFPTEGTT
jgi:threonine dehydrogenase-like Zn-dependent dehydrogenase